MVPIMDQRNTINIEIIFHCVILKTSHNIAYMQAVAVVSQGGCEKRGKDALHPSLLDLPYTLCHLHKHV